MFTLRIINKFHKSVQNHHQLRLNLWIYYSNLITLIWKEWRYDFMSKCSVYNKVFFLIQIYRCGYKMCKGFSISQRSLRAKMETLKDRKIRDIGLLKIEREC